MSIDTWESFVEDYLRAMQRVLLSELFPLAVEQSKHKETKLRKIRRITLEDHDKFIAGFEGDAIHDDLWKHRKQMQAFNGD